MKEVFWIGPIVNNCDVPVSPAISAAANKWQHGLIDGLNQNDIFVNILSYVPYPVWPRGQFWANKPSNALTDLKEVKIAYVSYPNIYAFRWLWIAISIFLTCIKRRTINDRCMVYTYNPYPAHYLTVQLLKLKYRIKWVSILADDFTRGKPYVTVFLSADYFNRYKGGSKYFLDGGFSSKEIHINKYSNKDKKILLYAGSQSKITGIIDFISLFLKIKNKNLELHIYGKVTNPRITEASKKDTRIKVLGFVPDLVLRDACQSAYAFVNPRSANLEANNTFPSKLLLYLPFKRPIISADVDGVSTKYRELLSFYVPNNVHSLENCLASIELMDKKEYENKVEAFIEANSWKNLTNGFLEYIEYT
jgi:hypothetical protein